MADNTASLVVALSAQLTKFEQDMKRAGIMAGNAVDDIEKKFGRMNPQVSSSFLGNFFSDMVSKGIEAATKALLAFKDRFIELDKQAKVTGESMEALWGFQQAGAASGASVENALKGLREMANLLNQMQRGEKNSLSQLLDVNPQALEGVDRRSMTVRQTWEIIANLVKNANTEFDKIDILRLAGYSEDMVKAFERGGPALKAIVDEATKGAPPLQQMAEQAKLFDSYMKSASEWIKADLAQGIANTRRELIAILGFFEGGVFRNGPIDTTDSELLKRLRSTEAAEKKALTRVVITGDRSTKVPQTAVGSSDASAWDRANEQITKHILLMQADAAAVGLDAGAHEKLRTEATLKAAAEKDHTVITEAMTQQMKAQAEAAGNAALALAVANDRMQKLNSASQTLGSAISTAFADAVVDGKKLNEVLDSLLKTLAKAAINASIMQLFTPAAGGGMSPFLSMLGLGKKAGGGPVNSGRPYLVGEDGPELMVPNSNGMVIPNSALGRGGGAGSFAPVYNINATGADTGTVMRIQAVLATHAKSIQAQARAFTSAQSLQATGVSR